MIKIAKNSKVYKIIILIDFSKQVMHSFLVYSANVSVLISL